MLAKAHGWVIWRKNHEKSAPPNLKWFGARCFCKKDLSFTRIWPSKLTLNHWTSAFSCFFLDFVKTSLYLCQSFPRQFSFNKPPRYQPSSRWYTEDDQSILTISNYYWLLLTIIYHYYQHLSTIINNCYYYQQYYQLLIIISSY